MVFGNGKSILKATLDKINSVPSATFKTNIGKARVARDTGCL